MCICWGWVFFQISLFCCCLQPSLVGDSSTRSSAHSRPLISVSTSVMQGASDCSNVSLSLSLSLQSDLHAEVQYGAHQPAAVKVPAGQSGSISLYYIIYVMCIGICSGPVYWPLLIHVNAWILLGNRSAVGVCWLDHDMSPGKETNVEILACLTTILQPVLRGVSRWRPHELVHDLLNNTHNANINISWSTYDQLTRRLSLFQ